MPLILTVAVLFIALFVLLILWERTLLASVVGGILFGGIIYMTCGIMIPRVTGAGHFYSVPFGGLTVTDAAVGTSFLSWCVVCGAGIWLVLRKRRESKKDAGNVVR